MISSLTNKIHTTSGYLTEKPISTLPFLCQWIVVYLKIYEYVLASVRT